jgi:large subunit ribosomal protein L15
MLTRSLRLMNGPMFKTNWNIMPLASLQRMGFSSAPGAAWIPFNANNISDNDGARRDRKRIGRGPGSGLGKTAGKGHKGQHARANLGFPLGFEGGQSALTRRMPKFGFRKNRFNRLKEPEQLNLGKLAYHIEKGDLDPTQPITMRNLYESGAVSKIMYGVKLLGKGTEKF